MERVIGLMTPFMLVLTRVSVFLAIVPVLLVGAPVRIRAGLAVAAAIFFVAVVPIDPAWATLSWQQLVVMQIGEAVAAIAMALAIVCLFQAARMAARMMERQMGFAFARMVDPISGVEQSVIGNLFEICAVIIFFAMNAHHLFFTVLKKSYALFPIGEFPSIAMLAEGVLRATGLSLVLALQMAAPVIALMFLITVLLGVLARAIPEMNVMMTAMPLRVGVGMLGVIIFMPYLTVLVQKVAATFLRILPV